MTRGYKMIRLYPKEIYGLGSHLAEKQRSKDAHPMEEKESGEKLSIDWFKCHRRPHPSVWNGDRTRKGLYSDERL